MLFVSPQSYIYNETSHICTSSKPVKTLDCQEVKSDERTTVAEKEAWSKRCSALWPCETKTCEPDYLSQCPKGWETFQDTGLCRIPAQSSMSMYLIHADLHKSILLVIIFRSLLKLFV